ncbi:hypothetical protein ACLESO_01180 [Pyxidicoccus sp. 3LG]
MLPEPHRRFLEDARAAWTPDPRLLGVAAGGSLLTGRMDAFSDLDLVVVCRDDAREAVMADRFAIARKAGALLQGFTGEHVGEPRLLICLYGPPLLHVDLKFVSLTELGTRIEDPAVLWEHDGALTRRLSQGAATPLPPPDAQWLEDRFWVWLHYGADKVRRGELFECIDMLAYLRSQVLAPLAGMASGQGIRGVRRVELDLARWVPALQATVACADAEDCGRALHAAVALYDQVRDAAGAARRSPAEPAVRAYLTSCFPSAAPCDARPAAPRCRPRLRHMPEERARRLPGNPRSALRRRSAATAGQAGALATDRHLSPQGGRVPPRRGRPAARSLARPWHRGPPALLLLNRGLDGGQVSLQHQQPLVDAHVMTPRSCMQPVERFSR